MPPSSERGSTLGHSLRESEPVRVFVQHPARTTAARLECAAAGALALATTGLMLALAAPAVALALGYASPSDWRDLTIYQVVTDRFYDGSASNNNAQGSYSPADGGAVHGGDWQGLQQKLDYIAGLGVGAVWISPVVLNAYGEYHGYAARDLASYSPTMGGLPALQSFIQAAHARGLYVIIDMVANHMGDLIDSGGSGYPQYDPSGSYVLRWRNAGLRHAAPFNNLSLFHTYGQIGNFSDPEQILGELFGLDDLKTETVTVRDALASAYGQMIQLTDCDGFRIDTVKHAELGFWQDFCPRIRAAATTAGKINFLLLGEVFDGDPAKVGSYTGTKAGGPYLLNSATWFPMAFAARWVFSGNGQPSDLISVYADSNFYDPTVRARLGNFFDNHDLGRLASFGLANQDDALLRIALTWLLSSPGIPIVYYGTEQEYDGGGDPYNREDLFDGQWDFGPSAGDGFHMAAPLYAHVRALNDLRAQLPALRRGGMTILQADAGHPGVLAYLRIHASGNVLVALNTATQGAQTTLPSTGWSAGVVLHDLLAPGRQVVVGAGGQVSLQVPGRSALLLAAAAASPGLAVVSTWPAHDGALRLSSRPARIVFDRPMPASASASVAFDPPLAATIGWHDSRTLLIQPTSGWSGATIYTLRVAAGAAAQDGATLPATFSFRFHTDFSSVGVTLPAGFEAEERLPFGLKQPLALEIAPPGWVSVAPPSDVPLVSDVRRGRILRLDPGQKVATFAVEPTGVITGMALDVVSQKLLVATSSALYEVDRFGVVAARAAAPAAWEAPWPGTGAHAGRIYLASPTGDVIYSVQGAAVSNFNAGLTDPRGLAQPPAGSGHPDLLYVCDPAISGVGSGRLYRIDAAGARTVWVSDSAVTGVMAIAFAPPGPFGLGNVYALDALGERVLRVDATGQVSVFATGFNNLYGSDALAFGNDGDLYVADPGGSESYTNTTGTTAPPRLVRIVAQTFTAAPPQRRTAVDFPPPRPNPFNPRTELSFTLAQEAFVRLEIFDAAGRRVALLADGRSAAGEHQFLWEGNDLSGRPVASGVYHARLTADGRVLGHKLVLVR
jgi:glycosidase